MTTNDDDQLQTLLKAGAALVGSDGTNTSAETRSKGLALDDVLRARLNAFDDLIHTEQEKDLENLELKTAVYALYVLERVHAALVLSSETSLGTRDTSQIRTLLSIVFKWGTEPLLDGLFAAIPGKAAPTRVPTGAHIIDLTSSADNFVRLVGIATRVLVLVLDEPKGMGIPTFVVATLMNRHVTDLLKPAICIAWMPDKLKSNFPVQKGDLRQTVLRLLSRLPPSQTIASLGTILSSSTSLPAYVRKSCSALLSQQLLRSRGVAGLLSAVFGEDEQNATDADAPIEKLEHVARVLTAVPAGKDGTEYYRAIIPRLVILLTPELAPRVPLSHKRAASFTLSRMLNDEIAAFVLLPILHDPFLKLPPTLPIEIEDGSDPGPTTSTATRDQPTLTLTPTSSLHVLSTLLTNTDPSPHVISSLLTPIFPTLYTLYENFHPNRGRARASDPVTREVVVGLMATWGKVAGRDVVGKGLWEVVERGMGEAEEWDWEMNAVGEIRKVGRTRQHIPALGDVARLMHQSRSDPSGGDTTGDANSNPLDLRPDPVVFVSFVKSIGDAEISSELFVKLLEGYRKNENSDEDQDDLRRTLLKLQLILQMQEQLGDATSSTSILKRPEHVLSFIKHALEDSVTTPSDQQQLHNSNISMNKSKRGMTKEDLRIVRDEDDGDEEVLGNEDSDDEDVPGLEGVQKGDEMTVTAVNLLLSLLEANTSLSARTSPILNEIYSLLEPLSRNASESIRPIAREARLVMTARLASDYDGGKGRVNAKVGRGTDSEETPEETYQRALKLLQDPILPVRAHGLLLLRDLVSPYYPPKPVSSITSSKENCTNKPTGFPSTTHFSPIPPPRAPSALIPAILSIFLEAIQDDDSYLFLNAVQGLAAMVDGWGAEVLRGLVAVYIKGLDGVGGGDTTASVGKGKGKAGKVGRVGKEVMEMEQRDVDARLRVGEALGQVIRRCGSALGKYVDILVPPLLSTLRATHLPTILRTSSISLLAQCVETNTLALAAYTQELCGAMVDLVQVETQPVDKVDLKPAGNRATGTGRVQDDSTSKMKSSLPPNQPSPPQPPSMDTHPTSINPKFPPLRRAALHFLALMLRSVTASVYDSSGGGMNEAAALLQGGTLQRASTVLGYVAVTDRDEIVRVMAREGLEIVEGLRRAVLGV